MDMQNCTSSNIVRLQVRQTCRTSTGAATEQVENPAQVRLFAFPNRARVKAARAQGVSRKSDAAAHVRLSKAECNARIRARIEAVGQVLNLSKEEIKPAMSLKHERVSAFAERCGLKLDWLIAGAGCAFRSRGELYELAIEFELLLKAEKSLRRGPSRLHGSMWRLAWEKLGADPNDKASCSAARRACGERRFDEALKDAGRETGYSEAWDRYNRANQRRVKLAKRILKMSPVATSRLGLMIRLRVLEADADDRSGVEGRMLAEVKAYFGKAEKAANCGD